MVTRSESQQPTNERAKENPSKTESKIKTDNPTKKRGREHNRQVVKYISELVGTKSKHRIKNSKKHGMNGE